jgi:hypothetical protein
VPIVDQGGDRGPRVQQRRQNVGLLGFSPHITDASEWRRIDPVPATTTEREEAAA